MLPQEGPFGCFLGGLLLKVLVAWQQILKTKVFSQQKGQIKGGRGNVLLLFVVLRGENVCLRASPKNILDRCSQLASGGKLEHRFRDVPVSKGTTWKRAGIPEKDIKTNPVSMVTTPETK